MRSAKDRCQGAEPGRQPPITPAFAMAEKIDIEASENEDYNKRAVRALKERMHKIHEGGGGKRRIVGP